MCSLGRTTSGDLGTSSKNKKCKKLKTDEPNDEYQVMMANMEALRELDYVVYANAVKLLGGQK